LLENWPTCPDRHSSPPLHLVVRRWPYDGGLPTRFRTEPHFGLGRYGDPIDPNGHIKAIKEIQRVAHNNIYFSVPIGREKLVFDSHRVFDPQTIIDLFDGCELIEFSIINDQNEFVDNADIKQCECYNYGCGLFHFKKIL